MNNKKISVPRVAILDPATGTGTFLAEIIKFIKATYFSGMREAFYRDYIKKEDGLLSRLIGFEIMMTSYAVAHLNVRRTIEETLGKIPDEQLPTNIFLTNTLAKPNSELERVDQMSLFDFSAAISDEAYNADTWKARRPIKVVIGNPPYLAASTNPFDIEAYKTETDGITKLNEKNPKWLNDDYVKFFRFAERIIDKNNEGILAFVSNNGFIDNPTFRGMRASLLRTFDKIYIVDLHGNSKKKETPPDRGKDENIFDIMAGISLFIGVKTTKNEKWAKVYHADIWGVRERKFGLLESGDVNFVELTPQEGMAYFIPIDNDVKNAYLRGISVDELFPTSGVGIVTARDGLCIQNSSKDIEVILREFQMKDAEQLRQQYNLGTDVRDWSVQGAKQDIETLDGKITKISYRPFDDRFTYYTGRSKGFHCMPRSNVMQHLMKPPTSPISKNITLITARSNKSDTCDHFFVSEYIVEAKCGERTTQCAVFPLYLHNEIDDSWTANFNNDALSQLTANMTTKPAPIEIFDYIYGILHDPIYRKRFNEFLKRDFPRVPIINSPKENDDDFIVTEEMFAKYIKAGEKLRKLHLMQTKTPATLAIEPNTADDLEIGAIKYKDGTLHLNSNKKILGIPEDVWTYRIGGYQVLDKWFKSHKGRTMTIDDFDHIADVVGSLAETRKIQDGLRSLHG